MRQHRGRCVFVSRMVYYVCVPEAAPLDADQKAFKVASPVPAALCVAARTRPRPSVIAPVPCCTSLELEEGRHETIRRITHRGHDERSRSSMSGTDGRRLVLGERSRPSAYHATLTPVATGETARHVVRAKVVEFLEQRRASSFVNVDRCESIRQTAGCRLVALDNGINGRQNARLGAFVLTCPIELRRAEVCRHPSLEMGRSVTRGSITHAG